MLEHGGRVRFAAQQFGIPLEEWLDLSTGLHPHGWPVPPLPEGLWQRLPELDDGLEMAAAAYYGTEHLLPVAGSQAALQVIPQLCAPGRVGVLHPTYAEHLQAWERAGHTVLRYGSTADLHAALPQLDHVVLVHPNNPTGARVTVDVLLGWHADLAARHGLLVVDEAFMDATPAHSLLPYAGRVGLIILRSVGKFFGLAGARVGFLCAAPTALAAAQERLGPWTITGPSRWVVTHALTDHAWHATTIPFLAEQAQRLATLLSRYGLPVAGGTALFQWVPSHNATLWHNALARRGILVRRFTDPPGLRFGLPGNLAHWHRLEEALSALRAVPTLDSER